MGGGGPADAIVLKLSTLITELFEAHAAFMPGGLALLG